MDTQNRHRSEGAAKSLGAGWLIAAALVACASARADSVVAVWTNRYSGEFYPHMAVDGKGNVFVTASSYNGSNDDYVTIAYSSAGVPVWTNRYNGLANGYDQAKAIAVD